MFSVSFGLALEAERAYKTMQRVVNAERSDAI